MSIIIDKRSKIINTITKRAHKCFLEKGDINEKETYY